jgi:hypothetical protein
MKSIDNTNLKMIFKNNFMNKEQYKVYPRQTQFVLGLIILLNNCTIYYVNKYK